MNRLAEMFASLNSGSTNRLADKSHAELFNMREQARGTPQYQEIAPAEHQAFAREWTQEQPYLAAPSLAIAAPLYYLAKQPALLDMAKKVGVVGQDATPASLNQLLASYKGIWQGLTK